MTESAAHPGTGQASSGAPGAVTGPQQQSGAAARQPAAAPPPAAAQRPDVAARPDVVEGPDIAELEDRWRRALADLDNLRKRYARELAREREAERERVTAAFLPVLDNLDLALQHAQADPRSIVEGVRALRQQALAIVAGLGFPREDQTHVPFDPARHEVVGLVDPADSQVAPGSVAQVVRPGYGTPEHQLRPAAVTVAQRPES
jgi:molecular chaperone GrpE